MAAIPTMNRTRTLLLALAALAATACPGPGQNPSTLWLSFTGMEADILLVDHEPPPF